jgi:transcriptional regulator with XRE-family HTH domain
MASASNPNIFCRRLKEARKAVGLSQKKLGMLAGLDEFVASTRINRYELGIHDADPGTATRLAGVLGVPLAYLYAEDDLLAHMVLAFTALPTERQQALLQQIETTAP